MRLLLALRCFFLVLFAARLPEEAQKLLPAPKAKEPPPEPGPKVDEVLARERAVGEMEAAARLAAVEEAAKRAQAEGLHRGAVQMLALLQRDGRLVDFLQEDVSAYGDAQIGAAVRDIHKGCRKVLAEHVVVAPLRREPDESTIRVEAGFDPSQIRLIGNVVGKPPFTGTLKHPGWRAEKLDLPELPPSYDATVIAAAEVELA